MLKEKLTEIFVFTACCKYPSNWQIHIYEDRVEVFDEKKNLVKSGTFEEIIENYNK